MKTETYKLGIVEDKELRFAVIVSKFNGKFVYGRHKKRETWEIPGGHREVNENIALTAERELKEETGAVKFNIEPVCDYSVKREGQVQDYGRVYYANIEELGELPNFEIEEIKLFDYIPEKLTYPEIQPILLKYVMKYKIEKLISNFKLRRIYAQYFENLDEVKKEIERLIPENASIGIGHSATLQKMGITKTFIDKGNIVYDKELAKDKKECKEIKKKALIADWYITGSNAVSVDGRIINVDHSGNRVAAITFGPDKVIIVVGINKIVDTWQEGIKRVKNIACPLNAERAGFNPLCVTLKKCVDCSSIERVCNSLSIIEGQSLESRIKVFIVNESLGF